MDLASGQDGMGAGLGLGDLNSDLNQIGDGGEFQGLGLSFVTLSITAFLKRKLMKLGSEFLQSLNQNSVYLTSLGAPSTSQISPTLHSPSPHNLNRGLEETSPSGIGIMESLQNNHSENGMGASFGRRDTAGSGSGLAGIERGASARESASGSGALSPPINKFVFLNFLEKLLMVNLIEPRSFSILQQIK